MICRLGAVTRCGAAVTVEQEISPERIVAAVRATETESGQFVDCNDNRTPADSEVAIDCESPTPVHEHVGYIHPEMGLRTRTALARAGRTRGHETAYDGEIAVVESQLADITVAEAGLEAQRQEIAETQEILGEHREAVAAARGRLQACRDHELETDDAEAELQAAIQKLSEQETTATAADQKHERLREQARDARERRERTFRLEDRLANLRRQARSSLVEQLREEFAETVTCVPETGHIGDPLDCQPVVAALAIVRIADGNAPVVLDSERFDSTAAAHDWLDTPTIGF